MKNDRGNRGLDSAVVVLGGLLIVLGVLFLLGQLFEVTLGQFGWPFFIIVPGVLLFIFALSTGPGAGELLASIGSVITMVGLLLLYQNTTDHWESWAYAWALVIPMSVGLAHIIYGSLKGRRPLVTTGVRLATLGIGLFLAGAVFFEAVIGISGVRWSGIGWPLVLIGVGLVLLLRSLWFGRSPPGE